MVLTVHPGLTPHEAEQRLRQTGKANIMVSGWVYSLDGSIGCPQGEMWAIAEPENNPEGEAWVPAGDCDQPVTEETHWVSPREY